MPDFPKEEGRVNVAETIIANKEEITWFTKGYVLRLRMFVSMLFRFHCSTHSWNSKNSAAGGEEHHTEVLGFPHAFRVEVPVLRFCGACQPWWDPHTSKLIVVPGYVASESDSLTVKSSVSCLITINKFLLFLYQLEGENASSWLLVKEMIIYLTIRKILELKKNKNVFVSFWIFALYVKITEFNMPIKNICTKMFIAALFIISQNWNPPKCSPTG